MHSPRLLAALRSVPIPHPFDLDEFLARVRATRRRPLHVHNMPADASSAVSGLWFDTRRADHLFIAPGAAGVLRVNIVLHEVGHMLLNHGHVGGDAEKVLRLLLGPVVQAYEASRYATRSRYDTVEERDAEQLATMILMRAQEPPADGDEALRKLSRTFGYES
ncbi:hypothetical protein [Nonomuraea sp. NPDC003214]